VTGLRYRNATAQQRHASGMRFALSVLIIGAGSLLLLLPGRGSGSQTGLPKLADPTKFQVELFVDLAQFGRLKAFQLRLSDGKQGFPRGLYVTSGPANDDRSDRLVRVDGFGKASIVRDGFVSNETMVFARWKYGKGILVSEPLTQRILRISPRGDVHVFAKVGTKPFGPAGLLYGTDHNLYVTDFSGARLLRVSPRGKAFVFAKVPAEKPKPKPGTVAGPKGGFGGFGGGSGGGGGAGGSFVVSTYAAGPEPTGLGAIYVVSPTGRSLKRLFKGMDGIEFIAPGPGGAFGKNVFVPTAGGDENGDGGLYTLDRRRAMRPFMTGVDAVSVVFDTKAVLGGGMFVSDINDSQGAGKIWRVRPTP
jgi:hypothetical protein